MLAAPLLDRTVLYDTVSETAHVLNASAALVWEACDGSTTVAELAAEVAEITGAAAPTVAADINGYLADLAEAGLVRRATPAPEPLDEAVVPVRGAHRSAVHAVIDDGVAFRSDDPALVGAVDALLGPTADDARPVTVELELVPEPSGAVVLRGRGADRSYDSLEALLTVLPTALNQIAATNAACLTLHSGGVQAPDGSIVLLPAVSGSGKTTLTAALVQAGWGYLSDEAVGVRAGSLLAVPYPKPLVLDPTSRAALGLPEAESPNVAPRELRPGGTVLVGEVGPVARVVLPRYESGAPLRSEDLAPQEAVIAILEHALNLARVGVAGLEALCQLAERVPVQRLVHGGIDQAVAHLCTA